ncbi:hypothetical protein JAAARDRAFT_38306 [Jaapia argillacea MUCL 33604]|uniref:Uncharacterized protein n=1 Tax=Jaapia argillacea MUCL 33604 TaxID=933084 RepID=A0A067PW97_9AGAM|nr:hypothetical protein JAAARDRAFT_38306 [Jaapia argillacea MUCL 33604]
MDAGTVRPDDIVIAIMGPTGSGKSNLVDTLMEQKGSEHGRSGNQLWSCTDKVQAVTLPPALVAQHLPNATNRSRIVLVDTPGFDDTSKSDMDILNMIGDWLVEAYGNDVKLAGIIYLHRISDNRMSGSTHKNLRMFGKLCGDSAAQRVILVSTMWDEVDPKIGESREGELKRRYWRGLLDNRASTARFTNTPDSAWSIIGKVAENAAEREALLLQEEMGDLQMHLNETAAGKTLYASLEKLLSERIKTTRMLAEQAASQCDSELAKHLEGERQRIQAELDATFRQLEVLKIPLGKKIRMFFTFRKPRARPIHVPPPQARKRREDVVIALLGPSGSGKSSFISWAGVTGALPKVGNSLQPCTSGIASHKLMQDRAFDVVLIDVPGFDDSKEALDQLSGWLKEKYGDGFLLSGLLYFHNITDNRLTYCSADNHLKFQRLLGKEWFEKVVLVTTMWNEPKERRLSKDEEKSRNQREKELKEHWESIPPQTEKPKAIMRRFEYPKHSARQVLQPLIKSAEK